MSEPSSAFLQLRIPRTSLVRWLDSPVPLAERWSDWRGIGGSYYFNESEGPIADISDEEMREQVDECDRVLRTISTNRDALRRFMDEAEAPFMRRCSYDAATMEFVAGTLTYSENLLYNMHFLTVARGAASFLEPNDTGLAILHNYIWYPDDHEAALRLGPGAGSAFVGEADCLAAAAIFQPIADEMLAISEQAGGDVDTAPPPIDMPDTLR